MQSLPRDGNNNAIQLVPSGPALARTVSSSISASTTLNLNAATTFLRVYAINQDVYLKWGSTAVTASNFDEVIPANQIVDLVIPVNNAAGLSTLYTTLRIIERAATATIIIIEK